MKAVILGILAAVVLFWLVRKLVLFVFFKAGRAASVAGEAELGAAGAAGGNDKEL